MNKSVDNSIRRNKAKVKELAKVIADFEKICNALAEAVNRQLFDGDRRWQWIADEIGGLCDFDDTDVLKPEDMVRVLESGMTFDDYAEWRDANIDHDQYINLKSWLMGLRHEMIERKTDDNA